MNFTTREGQVQEPSMPNTYHTAIKYLEYGLSVLIEKEKAPPITGYGEYRKRLPTLEELENWFLKYKTCKDLAILSGKISGNLQVIDIDVKNDPSKTIIERFEQALGKQDPKLFWKLAIEETPSKGMHLIFRCEEVGKNEDLALAEQESWNTEQERWKPIVELLAEGGKCTCYPSKNYTMLAGSYLDIPVITSEEKDLLLSTARSFNEKPEKFVAPSSPKFSQKKNFGGLSPWEDYDKRGDAFNLLLQHGWEKIGGNGETIYLKRPEKQKKENSASWNSSTRTLFVWTHKTIFEVKKGYSPSAVFAFLECQGDFSEAAKRLSEEGFGEKLHQKEELSLKIEDPNFKINIEDLDSHEKEIADVSMDIDRCHPLFRQYLYPIERTTEAPMDYIATCLLSSIAATMGIKIRLQFGSSWLFPNLYICIVGGSTFLRKSTSINYGLAPLSSVNTELKDLYKYQLKMHRVALDNRKKGDPLPNPPEDYSVIYPKQFSFEMLIEKMRSRPDGLMIFPELGELLARMQTHNGAELKTFLTDGYDGGKVSKELKSDIEKGQMLDIKNGALSILGASTPQWLQKYLDDEDFFTGFLGRFCFVIRKKYSDFLVPRPKAFNVETKWISLFKGLYSFKGEFEIGDEAGEYYDDWYRISTVKSRNEMTVLHSSLGRLETVFHKIALINHVLDLLSDRNDIVNPRIIKKRSYEQALPWIEFFSENIKSCHEDIIGGGGLKEKRILDLIKKKGEEFDKGKFRMTQSDILKGANFKDVKDLESFLSILVLKKFVKREKVGRTVYWIIKK